MANELDAADSLLSLHVIGSGVGESIILQIPHESQHGQFHWGVVDCYSPRPDPAENKTLQFLLSRRDLGAGELDFACITHPHEDHLYGFWQLFAAEEIRIERFWCFPADEPMLLKVFAALKEQNRGKHPERTRLQDELQKLFEHTKEHRKSKDPARYRRPQGYNKSIYERMISTIDDNSRVLMSIAALAPSSRQLDKHSTELGNCLTDDRFDPTSYSRQIHNRLSVVLHVRFGDTRIILGADAESDSWSDVVSDSDRRRDGLALSCSVIKVSHHGSENAIFDPAWEEHASQTKPTAIITPYQRSRLPRSGGLARLKERASVHVTSRGDGTPAVSGKCESRLLAMRARQLAGDSLPVAGKTIRVDHHGTVISVEDLAIA